MTISQRIFSILKEKKLKQKDMADYTGISTSAISAWNKNNTNPAAESISIIADFLGVSIEFLLTGEEKAIALKDDEKELLTYYKKLPEREKIKLLSRAETLSEVYSEQVKETDSIRLIPTYYVSNRVSAGFGEYLEEYEQGKTVYVPDTPKSRKADFVLTVSGDSMEPKFHDGDNILIRSQPTVDEGQIGIFDVDGEGYIKKLGNGELISLNHKYPNIPLKDRFTKCFGLVLGTTEIIKY